MVNILFGREKVYLEQMQPRQTMFMKQLLLQVELQVREALLVLQSSNSNAGSCSTAKRTLEETGEAAGS